MGRVVAGIAALGIALLPAGAFADPGQLRVVWADDATRTARVVWTASEDSDEELQWWVPTCLQSACRQTVQPSMSVEVDDGVRAVSANLKGLPAGATIWVQVGDIVRWFRTAPSQGAFSILYGGDSRSDGAQRRIMNRRMRALVSQNPQIIALAHGGDFIMYGGSWAQWSAWLDDWQQTTTSDGRVLPIIPARGNHETDGVLYDRVFGSPGGPNIDWFTVSIGRDFLLVVLDSNTSLGGDQRTWLDETLRAAHGTRWVSAMYHRPAYPAVKSPGEALLHWVPLFERHDVDFVLESDGHVLKRTVPIRGGHPDPSGVVYLGEGGLGVPQRSPDTSRWYLQPPGVALSAHHVQRFDVGAERVVYRAYDAEGEVLDRYEFVPRVRPANAPGAAVVSSTPQPAQGPVTTVSGPGCMVSRPPGAAPWWLLIGLACAFSRARRRRYSSSSVLGDCGEGAHKK